MDSNDEQAAWKRFFIVLAVALIPIGFLLLLSLPVSLIIGLKIEKYAPYGYIDKTGGLVVDLRPYRPTFPFFGPPGRFSEGFAVLVSPEPGSQACSLVDMQGKLIGKGFPYASAHNFSNGLAAVREWTDEESLLPIVPSPFIYPRLNPSAGSPGFVGRRPGNWGFIDKTGSIKIPARYLCVQDFSEGLAGVSPGAGHWQYVDKRGQLAFAGQFEDVRPFSQGRAAVRQENRWGLIDSNGRWILRPALSAPIGQFKEGFAAVELASEKRIDYLGLDGKVVFSVPRDFDEPAGNLRLMSDRELVAAHNIFDAKAISFERSSQNTDVAEHLVICQINRKYGFCDTSGKVVIAPKFEYCWPFSNGRALVYDDSDGGQLGFVDHSGKYIADERYAEAESFSEGLALVRRIGSIRYRYIDLNGQDAFHREFDNAQSFHEGLAMTGMPKNPNYL
jgi:WG containing repeat